MTGLFPENTALDRLVRSGIKLDKRFGKSLTWKKLSWMVIFGYKFVIELSIGFGQNTYEY